jgi:amino acid adenylation domain-containing protein
MAAPAPTQTNPASDGITLAELLALSPTAASARSRAELSLDASALQAIAAFSREHDLLPDSAFVAAWAMLQQPWCGRRAASWCEGSAAAGWRELAQPLDMQQPAGAFLRSVDQARRGASPVDTPRHDSAWTDADIAPGDAVVLALHADAAQRRLVATLPAEVDPALSQRLLAAIARVAHQLCTQPDRALHTLEVLDDAQRERLLVQWNPPFAAGNPALTVHGCFAHQVAQRPDAIALVHRGTHLTYAELNAHATRWAHALQHAGVQAGDTVAVALDRSPSAIVALLAVLKAGACYLPLDSAYPAQRLSFIVTDAAARLLITSADKVDAFRELGDIARLLVDDDSALAVGDAARPLPAVRADALAYVMYTSGSTGTPKGTEICHDAILRLVIDANYVELGPEVAFLHAAPLGFDASTLEIWGPLLNGGRCVLHHEELPTPAGLSETITGAHVNAAWLTAALFNAVVDDDPQHLRGLRQLLIGGEALSVPHVRRLLAALPEVALINGYGPTECTTFTATHRIPHDLPADARSVPIGRPITATHTHILGPSMALLPIGLVGELYVGGRGLARGYLRRPELTAERFATNPFGAPGERLYRTGDLVRYRADGTIEFIGRADTQVKIRGFRIELGEIEAALASHASVKACAVVAWPDVSGSAMLAAYAIAHDQPVPVAALREHLAARLPEFMVPAHCVWLDSFPITVNGKLDRKALPRPAPSRPDLAVPYQLPQGEPEQRLCAAFAEVLGLDRVGRLDNFFDLGGNSLQVLKVLSRLSRDGLSGLSTTTFFRQPTPAALARALAGPTASTPATASKRSAPVAARLDDEPIAIIAVTGRFPGAADVEQFWANLCAGKDGITRFTNAELDPSLPPSLTSDASYVKARGVITDVEMFDAAFFGIPPREAELMDPQQRLFIELCWECLERAGHVPDRGDVPVGVFGGMYNATYYQRHVRQRPDLVDKLGEFQVMLANEKDYIATRTANRLNLTGPAVSVHTACSTSLVAIAQAFWSLRLGQCDMALAGGVAVTCPPRSGYLYQEGAMLSPDGRTRSFDADAQGTVFSDGAAVVLLKRLSDALADGNEVLAVIRGAAVNNDGRDKASFTAPSVDGQAAVVAKAQESAGIDARSISYVETHGTATPLGDPVEVEALTQAFRRHTSDTGFCRIGSLKSNVGHMVIAAGAASVVKTALALSREHLPASIHFERPNPKIAFGDTPFIVNDRPTPWPRSETPRRAGVSSFGVGGTNAHVVLEEAPARVASSAAQGPQRLQLAARSPAALDAMATRLAQHLAENPTLNLADVAFTLQHGRNAFTQRLCVVADTAEQAIEALRTPSHAQRVAGSVGAALPPLVWLFPGQGAQYPGMGRALHAADPAFARAFDECVDALQPHLAFDLRARMFDDAPDALVATEATQPATFCLEYALAQSWLARGLAPAVLIGHSVGEFVAAVLAGVMSLADGARLVARRGALLQSMPAGGMLSVRLSADEVLAQLPPTLSLAAENGPKACVVAGPHDALQGWSQALTTQGVMVRPLVTSHAFHSSMMEPAVARFEAELRGVTLAAPRIPIVSTVTGTWLGDAEAADPRHWARHLREPVRFSPAVRSALERHRAVFLEVGPRGALSTLARQHSAAGVVTAIASLGDAPASELQQMQLAQGQLWTLGFDDRAPAASPDTGRRRVRLPTYPFERKRYWVDALPASSDTEPARPPAQPQPAPTAIAAAPAANAPITLAPATTMSTTMSASTPAAVPRHASLVTRLRELFEDIAGLDMGGADPASAFVELGIDSLTLTQVAMQVKKRFGVPVTFRQMSESYRSLDTLASYLDGTMPPDAGPAPVVAVTAPAAAPTTSAAVPMPAMNFAPVAGGANNTLVQQVIQQQMELMARQLALLGGASTAMAAVAPVIESAPVVTQPAPAQASTAAPASTTPSPEEAGTPRYDVKKAFGAIARIHTQSGEITARQRARLEAFVRRYVERTQRSKAYTVEHRPHLADPRVVNGFRPLTKEITYQIVVERTRGAHMWDIDGHEYVDTLCGFGMNMFGWQPDFVLDAVRKQIDAGYEIGPQHPLAGEVAKLICELTGFDRAGLCNTGSEAVMAAVRIARTVTARSTVVLFTGSYHGTFDEVLVRAGRNHKGLSAAPGILPGMFGDVRVLDYGTPESLEFIRQNADDLAAVLVEPVQSRRPEFQPREFLKEVRAITERSGTCLIFDEVITGFRAHQGGVQAMFDIRADLATYGKVVGGGMPIGVIAGKREFMDALDGGAWQYGDDSVPTVGVTYFAGTFVRHPLALAAAKASLDHLKKHGPALQTQLNTSTAAMADELSAFCREVGAPIEIRHFSSLWRVAWLEDHPLQDLLFAMMRSRGVHILDNFPCFMTTAHTPQDIATIKSAFKESVAELQQAEFLPRRAVEDSVSLDTSKPPVPGAKLGRGPRGEPQWFVPHPEEPGKYIMVK